MDATRETYWTVGHRLTTLAPMYLLALVALGVMAYGIVQRVKIYKIGKPVNRTDEPLARFSLMAKNMLLINVQQCFGN
mgnify:CR=1 FL=1